MSEIGDKILEVVDRIETEREEDLSGWDTLTPYADMDMIMHQLEKYIIDNNLSVPEEEIKEYLEKAITFIEAIDINKIINNSFKLCDGRLL